MADAKTQGVNAAKIQNSTIAKTSVKTAQASDNSIKIIANHRAWMMNPWSLVLLISSTFARISIERRPQTAVVNMKKMTARMAPLLHPEPPVTL
jgi:stage V sporulation protein SpoVS